MSGATRREVLVGAVGLAAFVPAMRVTATLYPAQLALRTMRSMRVLPAPTALGIFTSRLASL